MISITPIHPLPPIAAPDAESLATDAVADPGDPVEIGIAFAGFQKYLYADQVA